MSRVEGPVPLPLLPERAPAPRASGDFLARLAAPEANAVPPSSPESLDGNVARVAHRQAGAQARDELYGLAALPLGHLSYLAVPVLPEAMAREAGPLAAAGQGVVADGPGTGRVLPAAAATAVHKPAAGLPSSATTAPAEQATDADEPDGTPVAQARLVADWLRKLRRYEGTGGIEFVLRDYEGELQADELQALVAHCRRQAPQLARVVLNGHVVWSRTTG